jgi:hypothetical protein
MKGQVFEILAFVILAIAIMGVVLMMRVTSVGDYGDTLKAIAERATQEGVVAGINALFSMTEEKSGKNMQELVGIAAYTGSKTIDFGPGIGKIEVDKEIESRLNAMYGKGHWFVQVPYPEIEPDIQIVFIVDTSASLCDDIKAMSESLPKVIDDLYKEGKQVSATIYMLPGQGSSCCDYTIKCDKFPETSQIHCRSISTATCTSLGGQTEEDWGNGLACVAESGPEEGWRDFSVKIGIPVSDELTQGSENCAEKGPQYDSLQNGINAAIKHDIKVFPIKAEPCGTICVAGVGDVFTDIQCACSSTLSKFMEEIASKTKGTMYQLSDSSGIADALADVVRKSIPPRPPSLEIGSKSGFEQRQRQIEANQKTSLVSKQMPISISLAGKYTIAYIYYWP